MNRSSASPRTLYALLPLVTLASLALWRFDPGPREALPVPTYLADDLLGVEGDLLQASEAWSQGDPARSTLHLFAYLEEFPEDPEALFRLALCHLETGRDAEAAGILETLRLNEPAFYADATWYLTLAEIKLGRSADARSLLEELEEGPDAFYREKARVFRASFL